MASGMFHHLGRKASHEVLHNVDRWDLHSVDQRIFCVELPFLSPSSISSSSSCSKFLSCVDDSRGRPGSFRVPFAKGIRCFFTNTFLVFESCDVDFCVCWFVQTSTICYQWVTGPTSCRTYDRAYLRIFLSAFVPTNWWILDLSFAVIRVYSTNQCSEGNWSSAILPSAILSCTLHKWQ